MKIQKGQQKANRREIQGMTIIVDTREVNPWRFDPRFAPANKGKYYNNVTVVRGKLSTGDYSLSGHEDKIAIERKGSLTELVGNLTSGRERFERELTRSLSFSHFYVVIEDDFPRLMAKCYRSQMDAHAAVQSVAALSQRYNVPFLFAGNRMAAEYLTWSLLYQFLRHADTEKSLNGSPFHN